MGAGCCPEGLKSPRRRARPRLRASFPVEGAAVFDPEQIGLTPGRGAAARSSAQRTDDAEERRPARGTLAAGSDSSCAAGRDLTQARTSASAECPSRPRRSTARLRRPGDEQAHRAVGRDRPEARGGVFVRTSVHEPCPSRTRPLQVGALCRDVASISVRPPQVDVEGVDHLAPYVATRRLVHRLVGEGVRSRSRSLAGRRRAQVIFGDELPAIAERVGPRRHGLRLRA
jgi:hypothetical protein